MEADAEGHGDKEAEASKPKTVFNLPGPDKEAVVMELDEQPVFMVGQPLFLGT